MLTVNPLPFEEIKTLEEMHKNHPCHTSRIRAHAILLNNVGYKLKEIASIFNICRQTAAAWLHAWKDDGICGLFDKPRSGRPRMLCNEDEIDAITRVIESPRSLKKVLAELTASLNLTVSPSVSTLKRICKRAKLNWKRVRKSLRSKRDPSLFEQSRQQLATLIEQSQKKKLICFILTNQVLLWNLAFHMPGSLEAKQLKSLAPKAGGLMCWVLLTGNAHLLPLSLRAA
ncbi:MAG: helix-turn-helix domain-containing protein [Methylococcales bacterium]|nr:helix-turn-helix domain-containing protein [Methylococcales bacterium]